jgi:FkbM family methyltransferase
MLPAGIVRTLGRIPPFTSPRVRHAALRGTVALRRGRRVAFERLGSARYSRPALFDIDRKLEPFLPARPGFFVEAGASDGYLQSNTYFLERFRGWSGILVEPIPELYRRCVVERPRSRVFNCALVAHGYEQPAIRMQYVGSMSVVAGAFGSEHADEEHVRVASELSWDRRYAVDVPARTLDWILDHAGAPQIDLLSLDVEGYEKEVLRGLSLERHAPELILVEALEPTRRAALEELLGDRYELLAELSPYDLLFRMRPPA